MPVTVYRDLGYIGLAKQAVQGTPLAPTKFYKFTRSALLPDQKVQDYRNGNDRDWQFSLKESLRYAGTFQALAFCDEGAALMAWAMGADTITGAGDPYTHTLALTNSLPFLTCEAEYAEGQMIDRIVDGKISSLTISGEATKPIFLIPDFVGAGAASVGSPSTVTFNDSVTTGEGPLTFLDSTFTLTGPTDAATLSLQVAKFEIMLNQNVESIFGPGALTPIYNLESARSISLKFSVYISGATMYKLAYYGASGGSSPSRIVGTGSFVILAAIAGAPQLRQVTITLPNLNFTMARPSVSPDAKPALYEVEATAIKVGSTLPMTAVWKNGVATSYLA